MNFVSGVVNTIKPRVDDSGADRLNYYYTTVIIMVVSLTITARQYVGSPLQCWVPAQFSDAWEQYAENYCFVYNTYWVRPDARVPASIEDRIAAQLIYYQWVPFIMALEAFFFYLPGAIWGILSRKSGMNIESMVKTAQEADEAQEKVREKGVNAICMHLEDCIKLQKARSQGATFLQHIAKFGKLDGTYIANVYLITKALYIINLIGQFLMMNQFLGQNNHLWGATILSDIISGSNWEDTGNFPRIAMCDFQVRVIGGFQRYSIQCMLVLNMFNEKIFLFLYWWFVAVFVFTVADAIQLVLKTRLQKNRERFLEKYLEMKYGENLLLEQFITDKISADVMIIMRILTNHSSEFITRAVLANLWRMYKKTTHAELREGIAFEKEETLSLASN